MSSVKIYFTLPNGKQEIRRFTAPADRPLLSALLSFLDATYSGSGGDPSRHYAIAYDDGEDICSVSSEAEMSEAVALQLSAAGNGGVVKLLARFDDAAPLSGLSTPAAHGSGSSANQIAHSDRPLSPSDADIVSVAAELSAADLASVDSGSDSEYERIDDDFAERALVSTGTMAAPSSADTGMMATPSSAETGTMAAPSSSDSSSQTAADVSPEPTIPTQTDAPPAAECAATQTESTAQGAPVVDEDAAVSASSPVAIEDVTGHHEFVQPTPEPESQQSEARVESPSNGASAAASSDPSTPAVVHHGIACDGCGSSPLSGVRYHCTVCTQPGGFDLCERCEISGAHHPSSHTMLKMRVPASVPVGTAQRFLPRRAGRCPYLAGAAAGPRPRAQFISDVTLADGLEVHAGEVLTKVWSIKNVGESAWPVGTRLVFSGGDLAPESDGITDPFGAAVPFAGPGDVVHVSLQIQVPDTTGRFRGTFRLETPDGTRFGPRIWIDVNATEGNSAAEQPAATVADKSAKDEAPAKESEPEPVVAAAAAPVAAPAEEHKEDEEADLEAALAVSAAAAASSAAAVPGPSPVDMSSPDAAATPRFPYSNQLATLRSMGFRDMECCRYLLLNNHGDLNKVVAWLLNNSA